MSSLVSTDRFPIVQVRLVAPLSAEKTAELMASYAKLGERGVRMALLVDMRGFDPKKGDPSSRKKAAAAYQEAAPRLRASIVCEARIVSNTITRYVVTAFNWLTGCPWPSATFLTPAEAEAWIQKQLASDPPHFSRKSA